MPHECRVENGCVEDARLRWDVDRVWLDQQHARMRPFGGDGLVAEIDAHPMVARLAHHPRQHQRCREEVDIGESVPYPPSHSTDVPGLSSTPSRLACTGRSAFRPRPPMERQVPRRRRSRRSAVTGTNAVSTFARPRPEVAVPQVPVIGVQPAGHNRRQRRDPPIQALRLGARRHAGAMHAEVQIEPAARREIAGLSRRVRTRTAVFSSSTIAETNVGERKGELDEPANIRPDRLIGEEHVGRGRLRPPFRLRQSWRI